MSYQLLKALYHLQFPPFLPVALCDPLYDWLMEEASMTVRLEQYCQRLQVVVINEDYCTFEQLLAQEKNALSEGANSTFWLREVILTGDNLPWLAGRTIIPQETLQGPEQQLLQLGNQPLGRYLFASPALSRDYIEPGNVDQLWGRRSLLRLTNKPLLLTELFLPDSPLYLPLAEGYKPCDLP